MGRSIERYGPSILQLDDLRRLLGRDLPLDAGDREDAAQGERLAGHSQGNFVVPVTRPAFDIDNEETLTGDGDSDFFYGHEGLQ